MERRMPISTDAMSAFFQDLRYALRSLRRYPGFTTVATLALAVGIGANTVIFSLVNAVILQPLPYREPGRLVRICETIPKITAEPMHFSAPDVLVFQRLNQAFEGTAAYEGRQIDLS